MCHSMCNVWIKSVFTSPSYVKVSMYLLLCLLSSCISVCVLPYPVNCACAWDPDLSLILHQLSSILINVWVPKRSLDSTHHYSTVDNIATALDLGFLSTLPFGTVDNISTTLYLGCWIMLPRSHTLVACRHYHLVPWTTYCNVIPWLLRDVAL